MIPDVCRRKHGGNQYSEAANAAIHARKPNLRQQVLDYIERRGSSTLDQACAAMGKTPNSLSGRFYELSKMGLIEQTGETRETRSGCMAAVWRIKPTMVTDERGQGVLIG